MAQTTSSHGIKSGWSQQKILDARVSQAEVAGIYNSLARVYDIWGNLTESKARNRALELADIKNGQHVLEVAVGTGLAFFEIVKRNPDGTNIGIDISAGMLKKAAKRLSRLPDSHYVLKKASAFDLGSTTTRKAGGLDFTATGGKRQGRNATQSLKTTRCEPGAKHPVRKTQSEDEQFDVLMNNYMFDLISFDRMDAVLEEFKRVLKKGGKLVLVNMTLGEKFGSGIYDRIYQISPRLMGGCRGIRLSEKLEEHGFQVKLREYHQQFLLPSEVILAYK